ncbi:MAG: PIG-L deacetylase family protein [Vicinamibacterales bacterium]
MIESFRNVLAFFAHPDDETLAAGATMHRLTRAGCRVHVAIPNTGIHSRRRVLDQAARDQALPALRADCVAALSHLGVRADDIHLGEFPDNEMDRHTLLALVHWLEDIVARTQPDAVFTHHRFCTNIDHQYCHEAAVVATRPGTTCHIPLFCGEVPSSTGYLRPTQWDPNFHVRVEPENLDAKVAAMEAYASEVRPDPHPRSPEVLRALAKVRGAEGGFFLAEAFMVQRVFG